MAYSSEPDQHEHRDEPVGHVRLRDHRPAHRRHVPAGNGLALGEVDGGERRHRRPVVHRANPGAQLADRRQAWGDRQHRARGGIDRVDPGDAEANRVTRRGGGRQGAGQRTERDQQDVAHLGTLGTQAVESPAPRRVASRGEVGAGQGWVGRRFVKGDQCRARTVPHRGGEDVVAEQLAEAAVSLVGEPEPVPGHEVHGDRERDRGRPGRRRGVGGWSRVRHSVQSTDRTSRHPRWLQPFWAMVTPCHRRRALKRLSRRSPSVPSTAVCSIALTRRSACGSASTSRSGRLWSSSPPSQAPGRARTEQRTFDADLALLDGHVVRATLTAGATGAEGLVIRVVHSAGGSRYSIAGSGFGGLSAAPELFDLGAFGERLDRVEVDDAVIALETPDGSGRIVIDAEMDGDGFTRLLRAFGGGEAGNLELPLLSHSAVLSAGPDVTLDYWWSLLGLDEVEGRPARNNVVVCHVHASFASLTGGELDGPIDSDAGLPMLEDIDAVWELARQPRKARSSLVRRWGRGGRLSGSPPGVGLGDGLGLVGGGGRRGRSRVGARLGGERRRVVVRAVGVRARLGAWEVEVGVIAAAAHPRRHRRAACTRSLARPSALPTCTSARLAPRRCIPTRRRRGARSPGTWGPRA